MLKVLCFILAVAIWFSIGFKGDSWETHSILVSEAEPSGGDSGETDFG